MIRKKVIIIVFIALGTLLTLVLLVVTPNVVSQRETMLKGTKGIEAIPAEYDFGLIDQSKGKVTTSVVIKNNGNTPLKINRISTSCGCTTAEMNKSDLLPNESRIMRITFDPLVHKDTIGPVIRVVYLQTSDQNTPEIEITIKGDVIKKDNNNLTS